MPHPNDASHSPNAHHDAEAPLHYDTASVFHVHNVTKIYQMGEVQVPALRDITLDLYQGEFAVLLGASGSGKSTLLNILFRTRLGQAF